MKKFTLDTVRKFGPCFDPEKYGENDKEYTILDVINKDEIPFDDVLWLTLRTDFLSERTMRLFAVWSYRQTLEWIKNPDQRSIDCANVAERFANGEATQDELSAAWSAARSAEYAARSAAASASESARSAAWSAAASASESARSAARSAEYAAWSAADAAWSAVKNKQREKLKQMIIDGLETGDTY